MNISKFLLAAFCILNALSTAQAAPIWDTRPDTWVAMDALGRRVPMRGEQFEGAPIGVPRINRQVGMFYFLWHGESGEAGPFDISKILASDSQATSKPDSPLWGPMYAPHHWGEPLFGYYRADDEWVIRRHAQMLVDAGVDVIIFDVTNQLTYPRAYRAIARVYDRMRREGNRTPQIAFLAPFGDPSRVLKTLYSDFYQPKLHADLWYRWHGKPLMMADPNLISAAAMNIASREPIHLESGARLGQSFRAARPFRSVSGSFPTWSARDSAVTLSLFDRPGGKLLSQRRVENVVDNALTSLTLQTSLSAGNYYLEISQPRGVVGWWTMGNDVYPNGRAWQDGVPASGDRTLAISYDGDARETLLTPENAAPSLAQSEKMARDIRDFFTFRKPQPDYFQGPTGPDQWAWLETFPQHVFRNAAGQAEQMAVGVAQNALNGKLSVLSNPRAHGRSFHNGSEPPPSGRDFSGRNFAEQWRRARQVDPQFVFVTGWNEWIAGRFPPLPPVFHGMGPISFVDQFNAEFSRDIEPVRGAHGDAYYYQLVSNIRTYKGARAPEKASTAKTIAIDGRFDDWKTVSPEFRDDRFDTTHRNHAMWGRGGRYLNRSGRNDFEVCKIARDAKYFTAYARTRAPLSARSGREWMNLWLNTDDDFGTGFQGFDWAIRRTLDDRRAVLEEWKNGRWQSAATVNYRARGREIEIAIPRALLKLPSKYFSLDFKWTDNTNFAADALNGYSHGDTAPNGRFCFRYFETK